jgi:hypothetical protein
LLALALNPRKTAAPLCVLVCAALLIAAAPAAHAACPIGKTAYVSKGKTKCLKTAPIKDDPVAAKPEKVMARIVTSATRPARFSKLKIAPKIRSKIPKAIRIAAKAMKKADSVKFRARASRFVSSIAANDPNPVIDRKTFDVESRDLGDGVKFTLSAEALAHADDKMDLSMAMTFAVKGAKLKVTPLIEWDSAPPKVPCPSAEGVVLLDQVETNGVTITAFKGSKVALSVSVRETTTTKSRGHVGRDARLHDVSSDVTIKRERYERGLQVVSEYSGTASIPRDGAASATAPASVKVKVRAASASAAQEREAERNEAEAISADPATGTAFGKATKSHRFQMLDNERKWYDIPNSCATDSYAPDPVASLAQGASTAVKGTIKAQDGGEAHAQFTVNSVARGIYTTQKSNSDPGDPAIFNATGGSPDDANITVDAKVIATSTAGRTDANWYARDSGSIDVTFTGHGSYERDNGSSGGANEHHVTGVYDWSVTYRALGLADTDTAAYPTDNSVTGTWADNGRHGVAGAGNYSCGGPIAGYSGDFSMITASKVFGGYKLVAYPFFSAQGDIAQITCSGLGGAPYESFYEFGFSVPNQAILEFDPIELNAGSLNVEVGPTTQIAADCSDLIGSYETPCTQSVSWSGNVKIERSSP